MSSRKEKNYIIYECIMPFIIPVLFIIISLFNGSAEGQEIDYTVIIMLVMTTSFSVFISYIYTLNEKFERILQPIYLLVSIVGITMTLFFDTFKFKVNNIVMFTLITVVLFGFSIFSIYLETTRERARFIEEKEKKENEKEKKYRLEEKNKQLTAEIQQYVNLHEVWSDIDEEESLPGESKEVLKKIILPKMIGNTSISKGSVDGKTINV